MNILLVAVLIICLITLFNCVIIIPERKEYIIEFIGKYTRTMKPGLNIKLPIVENIRAKVDMREHLHDFQPQAVITKDNVTMQIDTVVYCKIFDSYKATYMISNSTQAIEQITATTLRNIVGTMTLDELLTARDKINGHLLTEVDQATDPWGIKVTRIEVKNIIPPQSIRESMEKQMKAERDKRATILEAQAFKEKAMTEAEGKKNAMLMEAEAKAKSIEMVASAEAEAVRKINEQNPSDAYIKLEAIKSVEKLAKGQATKIVVPSDIASLTSNIVALTDIIKRDK